jgi:hypothetical protein
LLNSKHPSAELRDKYTVTDDNIMGNNFNKFCYLVCLYIFLISSFSFSCARKSSPEITLTTIQDSAKHGKYGEIRRYLTGNTLRAIDRLKEFSRSSWEKDFARRFPEGSEWNMVQQEIRGDSARITMKCIDHPVENIRGFEMVYVLRLEGGIWKIDMQEELERTIERMKRFRDYNTKQ